MTGDFYPSRDATPDVPRFHTDSGNEVPAMLDVLPDGRETVVIGDVNRFRDLNHPQGDNKFGFRGTCGLVSCEDVLRQFGLPVTEADIVRHAISRGLCAVTDNPNSSGGTTASDRVQILRDFGVPASIDDTPTIERLAEHIENGRGVIVGVNAGYLWDAPSAIQNGGSNHAIVVTGVARDPASGEVQGFFINDSGRGREEDSGRFVEVVRMRECWEDVGAPLIITDISYPQVSTDMTGGAK